MFGKIRKFISEVTVELKKVSWSTKKELIDSTYLVLISSAFLGVFIAVIDLVFSKILRVLVR